MRRAPDGTQRRDRRRGLYGSAAVLPFTVYWLVPAAFGLAATIVGVRRTGVGHPDWPVLIALLVPAIGAGVLAASEHAPDVPMDDAIGGVFLAVTLGGAVPVYLYYLLGRALATRPVALVATWVILAIPASYAYFFVWYFVLDAVNCGPDAYECPF